MRPLRNVALVMTFATAAAAQTRPATDRSAVPLTVAVFDFDASLPGNPDLGKQVGDTLNALLSGTDDVTLVDRTQVSKTLSETELSLSGLVNPDQAVKVGKLVGARILITGKVFALDQSVYATAKLIGVETTRVEGVLVKVKAGTDTGDLVAQLGEKVRQRLAEGAAKLLPAETARPDPLETLKRQLAGKAKPVVMIQVDERQIGHGPPANDPPAETQLRSMFLACGFTVVDPAETTPARAKVELLVKGEAFGEFAARVQQLCSCTGRAKLNLVRVADGHVVATTQSVSRSADLSENLAGRTAVQMAAGQGGLDLLKKLVDTLPDKK